jgi:hypothetical protein
MVARPGGITAATRRGGYTVLGSSMIEYRQDEHTIEPEDAR